MSQEQTNKIKIIVPKQIIVMVGLAAALCLARIVIFHSYSLTYLLWNIFLAFVPFAISSVLLFYVIKKTLPTYALVLGGMLWLLFIPNAPYIVTDMIHIGQGHKAIVMYDTFLLFTSAWVGLMFGLYSIYHIDQILRLKYSKRITSIIIAVITLFASMGMYLGRFLRFNSWDIIVSPMYFFKNIFSAFSGLNDYTEVYTFIGLFFLFIYISYYAWRYSQVEVKTIS